MAGIEIALLSLGLKAVYEITVLSRSLDSVPSSLRRSLQLVQTCYKDLEDLIELRNLSIRILRTDSAWLRRVDSVIEDAQHGLVDVCKLVERVGPTAGKGGLRTRLEWMMKEATEFQACEGVIAALHRRVLSEMGSLRAVGLIGRLGVRDFGASMDGSVEIEEQVGSGKDTVREWDDVGLLDEMFGTKTWQRSGTTGAGEGGYVLPPLPIQPPPYDFKDFEPGITPGDSTTMTGTEAPQTAYTSEISMGLAMIPDRPQSTELPPGLVTCGDPALAQTTAFFRKAGDISEASDSGRSLNSETSSRTAEMRNQPHTSQVPLHTITPEDKEFVPPLTGTYSTTSEASLSIPSLISEVSHGTPKPRKVSIKDASSLLTRGTTSSSITSVSDFDDGMDLLFGKLNFYTPTHAIELPSHPCRLKEPAELLSHPPDDLPRHFSWPTPQMGSNIAPIETGLPTSHVTRPPSLQQADELSYISSRRDPVPWSVPRTSINMVTGVHELPDGEAFRVIGRINRTET